MKMCSNVSGHMTKMTSMPIYGKNFKNLIVRNQEVDDLQTWYTSLDTQVLTNFFKDDFDNFYDMVKFVS